MKYVNTFMIYDNVSSWHFHRIILTAILSKYKLTETTFRYYLFAESEGYKFSLFIKKYIVNETIEK